MSSRRRGAPRCSPSRPRKALACRGCGTSATATKCSSALRSASCARQAREGPGACAGSRGSPAWMAPPVDAGQRGLLVRRAGVVLRAMLAATDGLAPLVRELREPDITDSRAKAWKLTFAPLHAGERGSPGAEGPLGRGGNRGRAGNRGRSGLPGSRGYKGSHGAKGNSGAPGIDVYGPRGDRGPTGMIGFEGPPGVPGSRGPEGDEGHVGMAGPNGERGYGGRPGHRGLQVSENLTQTGRPCAILICKWSLCL